MTHEIKLNSSYADAIFQGRKKFEVRLNDRGYNAGDKVKFKVYDGALPYRDHPLNDCIFDITYVHSGVGLKEGYVVFGIEPEV